jgi:hypothetical protein
MSLHNDLAERIGLRRTRREEPVEDWGPGPDLDGPGPDGEAGVLAVAEPGGAENPPPPPPGLLQQLILDFHNLGQEAEGWEHGWRHQFRHHRPPSPADQIVRMADAGPQEMWHARWVARPGAVLIAVISLLTQEPRNSRIAGATLAFILTAAALAAAGYFALHR